MFKNFSVTVPVIRQKVFNICDFGAKAGGRFVNTEAFQEAMEAASSEGGGQVYVPDGMWLTGPIWLKTGVELHLADNAEILFTKNKEDYPLMITDYEGIRRIRTVSQINASDAVNIAITGKGIINGNGHLWRPVKEFKTTKRQWSALLKESHYVIKSAEGGVWVPTESIYNARYEGEVFPDTCETPEDALKKAAPYYDFYRPVMLSLRHCENVLIEGVTLMNSAAWNIHPYFCKNMTVRNINLYNPPYAQNGDGIDVDSCMNVEIHHCSFQTGDDAICLKAGKDREARAFAGPCENVYIHDCKVIMSPGGFVIGSEMSRNVRNVLVEDCTFVDSRVGINFKSAIGRGGRVEDIHIRNIQMDHLKESAITMTMDYVHNLMDYNDPVVQTNDPEDIPYFRNVLIEHCNCFGGETAVKIHGLTGNSGSISNILIDHCLFTAKQKSDLKDCERVSVTNCEFFHDKDLRQ